MTIAAALNEGSGRRTTADARRRAQQLRNRENDHGRQCAEYEDDAVTDIQTIRANQVHDPDQQGQADGDSCDGTGQRHVLRLFVMLASTTPSTTISAVLSGYLM